MKKLNFSQYLLVLYFFCGTFIGYSQNCNFGNFKVDPSSKKIEASSAYLIADDDIKCRVGIGIKDSLFYFSINYKLRMQNILSYDESNSIVCTTNMGNQIELAMIKDESIKKEMGFGLEDYSINVVALIENEVLKQLSDERIIRLKFPFYDKSYDISVPKKFGKKIQKNSVCLYRFISKTENK